VVVDEAAGLVGELADRRLRVRVRDGGDGRVDRAVRARSRSTKIRSNSLPSAFSISGASPSGRSSARWGAGRRRCCRVHAELVEPHVLVGDGLADLADALGRALLLAMRPAGISQRPARRALMRMSTSDGSSGAVGTVPVASPSPPALSDTTGPGSLASPGTSSFGSSSSVVLAQVDGSGSGSAACGRPPVRPRPWTRWRTHRARPRRPPRRPAGVPTASSEGQHPVVTSDDADLDGKRSAAGRVAGRNARSRSLRVNVDKHSSRIFSAI
jgi:hypothetical protein